MILIAFQHHDNSVHVEGKALGQVASQRLNVEFYLGLKVRYFSGVTIVVVPR